MPAPSLNGFTVVFDLDGTLIDTAPDLLTALNTVIGSCGLAPVSLEHIRGMVGHGAKAMLQTAFEHRDVPIDRFDLDRLFDAFISHYEAAIFVESRVFDGVGDVLEGLKTDGAGLSVCTNKRQALADQVLSQSGLAPFFRSVVGADSVPHRKPDPGHLLASIGAAGGEANRSLLVGDSETDYKTAKAGNIPCLLYSKGYSGVPVRDLDKTIVFDCYSTFRDHLAIFV